MFLKQKTNVVFATENKDDYVHTDLEALNEKLSFLQVTQEDLARVRDVSSWIEPYLEQIAKRQYDIIEKFPNLNKIIVEHSHRDRLERTFVDYFRRLFRADVADGVFWQERKRIGRVHSRIHVTADWYIGSYMRLFEYLIPAVVNQWHGKPRELSDTLLACLKMVFLDMQVIMEAYEEEELQVGYIENVSNVLELILGIEDIPPTKNAIEKAVSDSENISAATEQLSASVREVADYAVKAAEHGDRVMRDAQAGGEVARTALEGIVALRQTFDQLQHQSTAVVSAAERISSVLELIQEIAEQTHVLSLNAGIEAARAGEHGRGFQVIASEVRALANQTRDSIQETMDVIQNVQDAARTMNQVTQTVSLELADKVGTAQQAMGVIESIVSEIHHIVEYMGNIAASAEEQAAATEDIATRVVDIMDGVTDVKRRIDALGQDMYRTGVQVNDLRNAMVERIASARHDRMLLRIAKTDHLLWKWWLYNHMMGYHAMEEEQLKDHHECRLGKWYDAAKGYSSFAANPLFQRLDEPHQRVHRLASEIYHALQQDIRSDVSAKMHDLEEASQEVVRLLDALYEELERQ
ncbi:CZB domain-containing protein [Alicyclobacillus mali]|uniref:CZB domain-containing protein n=1 Tax=Alicyclobacillus mali (ex Roth et al. 2021) TaxID=1123961 RepID=A0ABS0F750_9BACL|nr:protoglobin domain-containing protein [Alicyclobacillus mali (ex Roth et al. 2021)]MBF8379136.1 CZB domain-containing protein [Alicyclobacillus mali (ex Roth et al. 2021)]